MLIFQVAYNIILPIFILVGLGVLLERFLAVDPRPLSSAAFYVFVPALIITGFTQSELQGSEIGLILIFEILLSLIVCKGDVRIVKKP